MYVLTSLEGATYHSLQEEFAHLEKLLLSNSDDPYFLGLYTGSLFNVGKVPEADDIANQLKNFQNSSGAV